MNIVFKSMFVAALSFVIVTMIATAVPAHPACHKHVGQMHCH